ncbi:MAG: MoaD family protein [Candidatus Odinarchaeota archaeon]|nr:MoaD family protein [Candidatus Odinarchaeota archaeon]
MAKVRILPLAKIRAIIGARELTAEGGTVEDILNFLIQKYSKELANEILDKNEKVKDYYRIVVNGRNIKLLNGLKTKLKDNDLIAIMPPIAGGC